MRERYFIKRLIPFFLLLCILGCEEEKNPTVYPPTLATGSVSEFTRSEAMLSGTAVKHPNSTVESTIGFLLSTSSSMADAREIEAKIVSGSNQYTGNATGLTPGTTYYFCMYAESGATRIRGEVEQFATVAAIPPVLSIPTVKSKSESTALLSGEIRDDGGYAPTQRGFAYKVYVEGEAEPTTDDEVQMLSESAEEFSLNLTNLHPNTTYIVRAYAINQTGTGYGESIQLTTDELMVPIISASEVSNLTAYTAQASGEITNDRGFAVTEQGFCWSSESRQPTVEGNKVAIESTTAKFSGSMTELSAKTKYYFRAYAINEKGVGYSEVKEFTTEDAQTASISKVTVSDITTSSVTVSALIETVQSASVTEKGVCWSKQANPTKSDEFIISTAPDSEITATISGLNEGETYYITAYGVTRDGTYYSNPVQFKTEQTRTAALTTPKITDIDETIATATATITNTGGTPVTEKGICWSPTVREPTIEHSFKIATETGNSISIKLDELTKGTKYFVRAYAKNKNGTSYSSTAEFTTAETFAPMIGNPTFSETTATTTKVNAKITSDGGATITEKGVCYSATAATPTTSDTKVVSTTTGDLIVADLTNLQEGVKYYVRAYAQNRNGISYSVVGEFATTQSTRPIVGSLTVMEIKDDNALAKAFISSNGGEEITERGFIWGPEGSGELSLENGTKVASQSGTDNFEAVVTGLAYTTSYQIRAYATNKLGTAYSNTIGFVTFSSTVPTLKEASCSDFTSSTATVNAFIDSNGGADITEVGACWSQNNSPTIEDNFAKGSFTGNVITVNMQNLTHNTTYYVRVYAKNKNGISYSDQIRVTTEKLPPAPGDNEPPGEIIGRKPEMSSTYQSSAFPDFIEVSSHVSHHGNLTITEKGFCWSADNSDPTVNDNKIVITTEGDDLRTTIKGLNPGTTYYVRSYAINEKGIGYSSVLWAKTEEQKPMPGEGDNEPPTIE